MSRSPPSHNQHPLRVHVENAVREYLKRMEGAEPDALYSLVLQEVHTGVLSVVMEWANHNQSKAAQCLGLSRGTLRKLLEKYGLEEHVT